MLFPRRESCPSRRGRSATAGETNAARMRSARWNIKCSWVIAMARTKIAETSAFTGRVDRLAMDWALRQETCRIAEQSALADFVARAESLCAEVDSGVLWRNTDWNIFEVLGRPRLEDAYSSVIGWLMNPTAPHGLRDAFLNEFFSNGIPDCRAPRHP